MKVESSTIKVEWPVLGFCKHAIAPPAWALLFLKVQLMTVASGFISTSDWRSIAPPETLALLSSKVESLIVALAPNSNLIAPPLARPSLEAELLVNTSLVKVPSAVPTMYTAPQPAGLAGSFIVLLSNVESEMSNVATLPSPLIAIAAPPSVTKLLVKTASLTTKLASSYLAAT